jgi:hypothetical protein|nr:MAG TPA: HNH endonuclease bacteriophage, HNH Endonuclease, DNA.52A [Caudoviricetes sp.]
MRTYDELSAISDYLDRYKYLRINQGVGERTFGGDRWLNQRFYQSREWKDVRDAVILRDNGFDMGHADYPINGRIYIHHMNPMQPLDLKHGNAVVLDPRYLISVSMRTHQAIHYGDDGLLPKPLVARLPGDTVLWGKKAT